MLIHEPYGYEVTWDEPDLLQNVKHVSPWLVELVSNTPAINLAPFSPPRKKLRFPYQPPNFPLDVEFPIPLFSGNQRGYNSPCGARHAHYGISVSDIHLNNKLQLGLFPTNMQQLNVISNGNVTNHDSKESLSCLLSMGKSDKSLEKSNNVKAHQFLLFGQPILTEQQITRSCSRDVLSRDSTRKKSTYEIMDKEKCFFGGSKSAITQQFLPGKASTEFSLELGLDAGHCKVFLESEDVGRTLDVSSLGSYKELYKRLSNMFGIERSEMLNHVLYHEATGVVKKIGEEPFSAFMKTAKRLTILMDSGSKNIRAWITETRNGEHGLDASNKAGPLSIFA
ncbi:putative transcription factor interactor and regulator AUX-IAA family [Lupinus albus]|uniref:Putative transcription factor interactor and regulator AUX-IAA family n=1 Tax=Lupinus albus TaxID=3870 RepID=A0A6A4QPM0_LUPAL|nr:putative transcription factor interactor and regulator AUX-IAA family [Lupinus albus]